MRIVEEKIYKFEELDAKIQQKVLNKFRENEAFDFLYDDLNEHLQEELKENGIEVIKDCKLLYDLDYSQGSGLCFEGKFKWKQYYIRITNIGHYVHNRSCSFIIEDNEGEEANDEVEEEFKELFYKMTNKLEKIGREEIEYQYKDETIIENINANDHEFYSDGSIY